MNATIQLRDYQIDIAQRAAELIKTYGLCLLAMEVRTGKTLTAIQAAAHYGARSALFLTTSKAVRSIHDDFRALNPGYRMTVTNHEQVHKLNAADYDFLIVDESHKFSAFPVQSKRGEIIATTFGHLPMILLSGTPTPESDTQIYFQLGLSKRSPFARFKNFYKWADAYVFKEVRKINGWDSNDYSMNSGATVFTLRGSIRRDTPEADRQRIKEEIEKTLALIEAKKQGIRAAYQHLVLSYSQKDAGFVQLVQEEIIYVKMQPGTYHLAKAVLKDKVFNGRDQSVVLADTPAKQKQKLQQIFSGAVLTEPIQARDDNSNLIFKDGKAVMLAAEPRIFDRSKAYVVRDRFQGQKIAIFYKFAAEAAMLREVFGERLTDDPQTFRDAGPERIFCCQLQAGREGINLSTADCLIMFNIDFSSVSYQQARARLQAKDRTKESKLYWLFAEGGIEEKIYQAVLNKQDYTLRFFQRDFLSK